MRRLFTRQSVALIPLVLALLVSIGCEGGGGGSAEPREGGAPQDTTEDLGAKPELTGPAAAVHAFLEGARRGDDAAVEAMLTATARKELGEIGLKPAPRASDTARFSVGEAHHSPEDASVAYVSSIWTEVDPVNDRSKNDEIVWALRNTPEGWRVAGMVVTIFEGEAPWAFNFESAQEMQAQGERLLAEKERRAAAAEATARSAGNESVAR